jgi:stage III sporulation protein AA
MIKINKTPFEQAVSELGGLKSSFDILPRHITDTVCEVRLRAGHQIILETVNNRIKIGGTVTTEQIAECIREFCGYSIHSYEKQFREGWLTLKGGHRAGFTGTAVLKDGRVENVRDVSSVNLRIAKQYIGCGENLHSKIYASKNFSGLLIIGRPMSAKTTVLRDLCRLLSKNHKISLIDERGELAAVHNAVPTLDVGENTDVLSNFPKGQGIMTALRNLSPEYVLCDEIGWEEKELTAVANSGVRIIVTAHSGNLEEAYSSNRIRALLETGGISHIALLGYGKNIGRVEAYELNKHKHFSSDCNCYCGDNSRTLFFKPIENAGGVIT